MKPSLRGVLHHYAFYVSLAAGLGLVWAAPTDRARVAAAAYGASLSALLATSALYHCVHWSPGARRWMARLDHAMINLLIAGTYTPFGLLVMREPLADVLLTVVWVGAVLGIVLHLAWIDMPKWVSAAGYVALGWVGVLATPELVVHLGWTAIGLLLAGGLLYSLGALVYARRRPDPLPTVFGYHEVFHALVVVAAAVHFAAVAMAIGDA
jgi:hemolysin III